MAGSISLPRDIVERSWAKNPITMYLFIRLLIKANWKDGMWFGVPIGRGELVTSISNLSKELGLKDSQTRYALRCLQNDKRITSNSTNQFTKITICDYDIYQFSQKTDNQTGVQTDLQADSQTSYQTNSNNRINEEKDKGKKENNIYVEAAERIYALYPASCVRSGGNRSALKSKSKDVKKIVSMLSSGQYTEERLTAIIKRYLSETNPPYLMMLKTFLNNPPDYGDALPLSTEEEDDNARNKEIERQIKEYGSCDQSLLRKPQTI